MRTLTLLILFLVACSKPAPIAPTQPPVNLACQQARTIDKSAACLPLRTAVAGVPDLALADVGTGVLVRCSAGEGMGAGCVPFADLRPRKEEPKSATAASSPEPVKLEVAKPDAKPADKPKDPPKKPEPKK